MMDHELVDVRHADDWVAFHTIRRVELFEERGRFGVYSDTHPDDTAAFARPYLLKKQGRALGTARLDLLGGGRAALRLVAITRDEQGLGHGRIMEKLIADRAPALGVHTLVVNAAEDAIGFYHKTGWHPFAWDPEELVDSAVSCVQMRKLL